MEKKLTKSERTKLAEQNARHLAGLHIETGNAPKIAEAFKDIFVITALEFLFAAAEKYRAEHKLGKAAVILEAAALIDRTTGIETDIVLGSTGSGKQEETTLSVRRHTPAEIFNMPIVYTEIIED